MMYKLFFSTVIIALLIDFPLAFAGKNNNDIVSQGKALQETADSLFLAGNLPEARQHYYQALNSYDKSADSLGAAYCQLGIAKIAFFEGYFTKAQKLAAGLDSLFLRNSQWIPAFETHRLSGDIFAKRGQYEDAVWHYRAGVTIGEKAGDKSLQCAGLRLLGKLSVLRGSFHGANLAFSQALEIAPSASDSGYAYVGLGDAWVVDENYPQAFAFLDSAEMQAQTSGDSSLWADVYGAKAQTYRKMGNYHRSLDYYGKQLDLIKTRSDQLGRAKTMMNMAAIFEMQKQYAKAADFMEEVVLIFEELNSPETEMAKEFLNRLKKVKN